MKCDQYPCKYCFTSCAIRRKRTTFKPDELATTFVSLKEQKRVDGLFLSSGIVADANTTMEKMLATVERLRRPDLLENPSLEGKGIAFSPTGHTLHIARTFALSYKQLDADDPVDALALALLARAAHFAPGEPIPDDLLRATLGVADDDFATAIQIDDALNSGACVGGPGVWT